MSNTAPTYLHVSPRGSSRQRADAMIAFLREYGEHRINSRLIDERRCIPPHVVLDCAREGLFGLQVEKRHGGQELGYVDSFRVLEQVAAVDPNLLLLLSVHHAIGTPPIRFYARDEVKEQVLPLIATGRTLATIAASEPGAGAHLSAISTTARRLPNGDYILNGDKCWISLGSWAGYVNVFAQLTDERGQAHGMTGFLVEQGTTGFAPGAEALTLGMKGIPQNQIALRDVRVPASGLLGEAGQGSAVAQKAFMMGRAVVAISAAGVMKRCLQLCARYARRRDVATGNLFENGSTVDAFNDSVAATNAVEAIAYDIARSLDRGAEPLPAVYIAAKVLGAELMWRVIDRSVQLLGARGFMDTNVVGQYFRDMRLLRIFEGPTESMTGYLGATVLKDEERFLASLASEFGQAPTALRDAIIEARALYAPLLQTAGTARQARERLGARVGELAAWAILGAVQGRSTHPPHRAAHASDWCRHQFEELRRRIRAERAASVELPSSRFIASEIDRFTDDIAFIEQGLAGEYRELDPLLRDTCRRRLENRARRGPRTRRSPLQR